MKKFNHIHIKEYKANYKNEMESIFIKGGWIGSAASFECSFDKGGEDSNSAEHFNLTIKDGQVWKGEIDMHGSLERRELIETLEFILDELKK